MNDNFDPFSESNNIHRLLKRQMRKAFPNKEINHEGIIVFLELVNNSYLYFDEERKLSRRAEEISSNELKDINAELAAKNEFLDGFNYGLAHDAKNHTANLKGLLSMLKKYENLRNYEKVDRIMLKMETSINQMTSILDGFLYLSTSAGLIESNMEPLSLSDVKELIFIETAYLRENCDCHLNISLNVQELVYSKDVLRIILVNLISNSLKFAKDGETTIIDVRLEVVENELYITVVDNGIGMDLGDETSSVFKLFDRKSNAKKAKGFGIGLYMIKNVLDRNNGEIDIESKLREGTKIKINLPISYAK